MLAVSNEKDGHSRTHGRGYDTTPCMYLIKRIIGIILDDSIRNIDEFGKLGFPCIAPVPQNATRRSIVSTGPARFSQF